MGNDLLESERFADVPAERKTASPGCVRNYLIINEREKDYRRRGKDAGAISSFIAPEKI
jgi:hypothetical protein